MTSMHENLEIGDGNVGTFMLAFSPHQLTIQERVNL